jgi:transposase
MSNQQKNRRPKYSLEFKKDAVQLVIEKGYTHEEAAKKWAYQPVR